ncbi:unnamed protein product [Rhodiola kirilowii]
MKDGETVNYYLARVITIAKKIKACGGGDDIKEIMIIEKIMRSLSKKFNYRMVDDNEDEQVLKISCDEKGIGSRGQRPYRGSFKGGRGRGRSYHRAHVECFKCHKIGHYQFDCPNSSKVANYAELDDKEELLLMSYVDKEEVQREGVWFLNSGCSIHMTGFKHWFTSLDEGFRHSVKLGNNERIEVRGKGTIKLVVGGRTYITTDVYYVPNLTTNLLSVGQLQERRLSILIENGNCKIFQQGKRLILLYDMTKENDENDNFSKQLLCDNLNLVKYL